MADIQQGEQVSWPTKVGATWTLQSAIDGINWSNVLGPTAGNGLTNTFFDPLWPAQATQYRILEITNGAGNILANPGFETGSASVVSNWTTSGSQPATRVNTDAHDGSYSMQLFVTNTRVHRQHFAD
ncbi:MAG: hypothetical protein WDN00_09345 [Limisphaerales bacterium]